MEWQFFFFFFGPTIEETRINKIKLISEKKRYSGTNTIPPLLIKSMVIGWLS